MPANFATLFVFSLSSTISPPIPDKPEPNRLSQLFYCLLENPVLRTVMKKETVVIFVPTYPQNVPSYPAGHILQSASYTARRSSCQPLLL